VGKKEKERGTNTFLPIIPRQAMEGIVVVILFVM